MMELDLFFGSVNTSVYLKMGASEQLLLAEVLYNQLRILNYHPDVLVKNSTGKNAKRRQIMVQLVKVSLVKANTHAV